jgi:hypothetical protein
MNIREHIQSIHPTACSTCNDLISRETGWLIEKQGPMWLTCEWQFGWTDKSNNAIRFSRRSDAEQIASMFENEDIQITEHYWMPSILELIENRQNAYRDALSKALTTCDPEDAKKALGLAPKGPTYGNRKSK